MAFNPLLSAVDGGSSPNVPNVDMGVCPLTGLLGNLAINTPPGDDWASKENLFQIIHMLRSQYEKNMISTSKL